MQDAIKFSLCRIACYQELLGELQAKHEKITITARREIMTKLLGEENSLKYLLNLKHYG